MQHLTPPRFDLYGPVHKALRAFMADSLIRLGRLDADDPDALGAIGEQLLALIATLRKHLDHEDEFIHPLLQRCRAGSAAPADREHGEHRVALELLAADVRGLLAAPSAAAADAVYQQLALLVADNLAHMRREDVEHQALLWAHCSDAELIELHERLVASIPPEEFMGLLRWMLPAITPQQRAGLLAALRAGAPAPVFEAVHDLACRVLDAADRARLDRDLAPLALAA